MKHAPFSFPEWIASFVPDDDLFAEAYQAVTDEQRAWIKTGIARMYDWYGPRKDVAGMDLRRWTGGFETRTRFEAVDFTVVFFDDTLLSPVRLLAGLIPAVATGVEQVIAVRVSGDVPWRRSILTGLELAGQELVANLDARQSRRLLAELRDTGRSGSVVLLGPKAAAIGTGERYAATRVDFWRPRFSRMATVWMEDETTFDLAALAFMHPDIAFAVYGVETAFPAPNFTHVEGGFEAFLGATSDVAYLPADRMSAAAGRVKLALGPGLEGCWIWPDLHPLHFQFHSSAWTIGD